MSTTTAPGARDAAHSARTGPAHPTAPPPGARRKRRVRDLHGWFFLAPYIILLLGFGLGPTGYAIFESFVDERGDGSLGGMNYTRLMDDFRFWPAVTHVAIFLAVWLPIMVVGVLILALLLHDRVNRFSGAMRMVFFLPAAVTGSASVVLWYFMLDPTLSPFGPALNAMGFEKNSDVFQSGNLTVVFALIAFTTGAGQWIVIMYGALQNVPEDVLEAASIDGCGRIRTALFVKLPLVGKYVLYMVILSFATGLQLFVEPQLIYAVTKTAGTPWWSLNQLSYTMAFTTGDFGGAAAVSVVLLVLSTIAALVLIYCTDFFKTEVDE
ncbi:sugar ABC transporter permease [Embleya sp. NBC_00888]|uniref:carbohydrate ABC transporter permease n=1 Tax=Embleya sp. NBC_00888 TaxID=2975960 RepID=UPI00386EF21E|nr:sugar ABC transporter permease [Embleya sp. NBC_00888]